MVYVKKPVNGNIYKEPMKKCSLCHCYKGSADPNLLLLPNGEFAEVCCLNQMAHKEIVIPAKEIIPVIKTVSSINRPEVFLNSVLDSLRDQPKDKISGVIKKIDSFAQKYLGKKILPKGFIPTY